MIGGDPELQDRMDALWKREQNMVKTIRVRMAMKSIGESFDRMAESYRHSIISAVEYMKRMGFSK